mgnify:CR=1 FL=1
MTLSSCTGAGSSCTGAGSHIAEYCLARKHTAAQTACESMLCRGPMRGNCQMGCGGRRFDGSQARVRWDVPVSKSHSKGTMVSVDFLELADA